jgi:VCBS repeat protein
VRHASAIAIAAIVLASAATSRADEWRLEQVLTQGPVKAVESAENGGRLQIGNGWFRALPGTHAIGLAATVGPAQRPRPKDALPDGRVAEGKRDIARAWLAEPTGRYGHGVLGDAIEAGSLAVERRDGTLHAVRLQDDAVFEDLEPRIVGLDGHDRILVVKSYLKRGSALAVIGERNGSFAILSETPPIGTPHRWLNPAGVADFDGDGRPDIALVRMPHAAGVLELWAWRDGNLTRTLELKDVSNHFMGSRVLRMSAVADFDGDGHADLAIPSFDRRELRLLAFTPNPRDIARIKLPARITTEIELLRDNGGMPIILTGLENGAAVAVRKVPKR